MVLLPKWANLLVREVKREFKKSQVLIVLVKMRLIKKLLESLKYLSTDFDESIITAFDKYLAHHTFRNI